MAKKLFGFEKKHIWPERLMSGGTQKTEMSNSDVHANFFIRFHLSTQDFQVQYQLPVQVHKLPVFLKLSKQFFKTFSANTQRMLWLNSCTEFRNWMHFLDLTKTWQKTSETVWNSLEKLTTFSDCLCQNFPNFTAVWFESKYTLFLCHFIC